MASPKKINDDVLKNILFSISEHMAVCVTLFVLGHWYAVNLHEIN